MSGLQASDRTHLQPTEQNNQYLDDHFNAADEDKRSTGRTQNLAFYLREQPKMNEKNMLTVHVNVGISPASVEAVVDNAKRLAGRNEKGRYTVDTADMLSRMIGKFLKEKDFESYVKDASNYSG